MAVVFSELSSTNKEAILPCFEVPFPICCKELRESANSWSVFSAGVHKLRSPYRRTDLILQDGTLYVWMFSMEFASFRLSGA
jgi:hypothetical protein